jgi:type I restriction enzyme, S subunit
MSTTKTHTDKKTSAEATRSKTLAPKLRFKNFADKWHLNKLDEVAKITSGGTPSRTNNNFWNGNVPWISTSLIDFNLITKADEYITEEGVANSSAKVFPVGTILMAMYGQGKTRGKVAVLGIEATTNQACAAIITGKQIDSKFLFQNLAGRYDEIRNLSNEGGQQNLSGGIIKEIKVSIPSLPEQQKIASFLSAVDEKIQQLTRKKELLEQYKKGVMQQLFSGKLRFKDENGKPYPKWEEKKIGDLTKVIAGGTPSTSKKEYWGGDVRWMNSGELNFKIVWEVENRITQEGLNNSSTKLIPKKCVLIGLAGQGKTRGTVAMNMVELCTNQSIAAIFPNDKLFDANYLYQNLDQRYEELRKLSTGEGGRGGLNLQIIKSLSVPLPSIKEQQKIASFLTALDAKIENVAAQIAHTQTFKKGLLQQMFV